MRYARIKDVITDKISGEWGEEAIDGNGVIVIRTANFLNSGKIKFSNLVRREVDPKKIAKKKLISGDIIIEKSGGSPTQPVGRVVIFRNPDDGIYLCNNFTSILRPNKNEVHPEYLFYILHNNHRIGKTLRFQNKTTGIINLKLDSYLDSEIPLPPLDDQIRIAHLLSKVEGLIAQRKLHLQQLDDLLKSVFLEMFGDPVRNEKGWETSTIEDLCEAVVDCPHSTPEYATAETGYYCVRSSDIVEGYLDLSETYQVDKLVFEERIARYRPQLNDIVYSREGGRLGNAARIINQEPICLGQRMMLFKTSSANKPEFVWALLESVPFKTKLQGLIGGGAAPRVNIKDLKKLVVIKPDLELQKSFSKVTLKIDKLRERYGQHLTELEALYGALSAQAFKGELDLSRVPLPNIKKTEEIETVASTPLPAQTTSHSIKLPETELLLQALENREFLKPLLHLWLEAYRAQLGEATFSAEHFMAAAQNRLAELSPDTDVELDVDDYEQIKTWVFEALAADKLTQTFEDAGNRIQLKATRA